MPKENEEFLLPNQSEASTKTSHQLRKDAEKKVVDLTPEQIAVIPNIPVMQSGRQDGSYITLREVIERLHNLGSTSKVSGTLDIPVNTARQNIKMCLELMRRLKLLDISPQPLDKQRLGRIDILLQDGQVIVKLEELNNLELFQKSKPLLSFLNVSSQSDSMIDRMSIIEFIEYYFGWNVPKKSVDKISEMLNRASKNITSMVKGAMCFFDTVFGTDFDMELHMEATHYHDMFLIIWDKMQMAKKYLEENQNELLEVEKMVLGLSIVGLREREIKIEVEKMRDDCPHKLVASPGSVPDFLAMVYKMRFINSPFMRVRVADQADQILNSNPNLDSDEIFILESLRLGWSAQRISEHNQDKLSLSTVLRKIDKLGINFLSANHYDRETVRMEREQLFEDAKKISFEWRDKDRDLRILSLLSLPRVPTYDEISLQLRVDYSIVELAVARSRAMVSRSSKPEVHRHASY